MLYSLKIIDEDCNLTEDIGLKVGEMNLDTKVATMVLNSFNEEFVCSKEIIMLAALLSVQGFIF